MKKIILGLLLLIGSGAIANAQDIPKSPEKRAEHMTKVLQKKLNLSQDQASKTHDIFLAQATSIDSLVSSSNGTTESKKMAVRTIRRNSIQQVLGLLNDDQKQKFTAWEKARKEKQKNRRVQGETMPQQG